MASTWSALKIELLETGQNSGQWGNLTNVNLGDAVLGEAITGSATVDFATDADVTITLTDSATTQSARNLRLNITESSTGIGSVRNLILGSGCQIEKFYLINNTGTGAKTVKNTSGTGISVPAGKATLVYNNGTNVVDAASYFTSLTLGSALSPASGGTGVANNAASTLTISGSFASNFTVSGAYTYTFPGQTSSLGYLNIPQSGSAKTTSYTLAVGDVGEFIEVGASGAIVVPNATFAAGDAVVIFNNTSGAITLTMSITTAYIGGTDADKATISLATRGICNVLFISGTVCVVTGNVT
jgi:hypothetical protein